MKNKKEGCGRCYGVSYAPMICGEHGLCLECSKKEYERKGDEHDK